VRFRIGDAAALAASLESLLDNPDLLHALGAGARQNASRYDWPRIVQRCQEVYATL
jgi:glycosyltransferase involved in cell wall biosynthesis